MALKIAVVKNHLPTCQSPYIVRSAKQATVEFDRFLDIMASGRTTLTRTDIVAAMQLYKEELQKQLKEGNTVKTPVGSFFLSAAGSLDSLNESFLPKDGEKNHEVRLHLKNDKDFEDSILADLTIVREERPDFQKPVLYSASPAGEEGSTLRAGGIVVLKGLRLNFDTKASGQGLFFVDSSGAETRASVYPLVLPSTVMAVVPAGLAAGTFGLALRAAVNGKDIKEAKVENLTLA